MTFGIDIASPQRDIDLGRAKADGVEFVIVKMGGLNVTPQYVAPYYRSQVDRVVAAGLPKGHYYLIGKGQTPEQQAEFFVANLYRFDPERDVLALDNEALDSNGTRWSDSEATRFARRVLTLTHIPVSRFWHYAGATDYRAHSWPELSALGVRFWWAAYGNYPTGHTPDHEPSLQGSIPRWDVHQYSSRVAVAGYALDGNHSPHSVSALFGGGTMEDQMRQYIAANRAPYDRPTWDQMCGSLMHRFNSWRGWNTRPREGDIDSAYEVATKSGWLNTDFTRAPVGAWHFFDIAGPSNGHVMQDARGGGLVNLSTGYALSESLGSAIGFQSVPGYVAAKGARYMGWSTNYAGGTISTSGLAGLDTTPIPEEEEDMPKAHLYRSDPANGGNGDMRIMNLQTGFDFGITSQDYLNLIAGWDLIDGFAVKDANGQLVPPPAINLPGNIHQFARDLCASVRAGVTVDAGAIAAAVGGQVAAVVKAALAEIEFDGDAEAIAARVEQRLADDFVKVNANIDDQPTTFEITPKG